MATLPSKLNISLDAENTAILAELAQQNHHSVSAMAKTLILEALEHREDMALTAIAKKLELSTHKKQKKINHQDAWK